MVGKQIALSLIKKMVKLLTLLCAVSVFSFVLVSSSPIDPIQSYVGADLTRITPEQRENIEAYWGLHDTKSAQFFRWAKALIQGDFGTSLIYRAPVNEIIAERFLNSLVLMGIAWVFSGLFGFLLGIVAGMKAGSWLDRFIKAYCFILKSTPAFWLGLLVVIVFSVWLGWFPIGLGTPAGVLASDVSLFDRIRHLMLPAFTLSIVGVANIALHTRQKFIDVLNTEFIRFAKARGEKGWKLVRRHMLRHTLLPAISLHFASFGELFGGAVLAEQVFSYPGLGQTVVQAGLGGDVPLLLGIVICSTVFVFMGNMIADGLYKIVDPRIQREGISWKTHP